MYKTLLVVAISLAQIALVGCETGPKSAKGFSLPDGDIDKGRAAFEELRCNACHKVADIDQVASGEQPEFSLPLGGEVTRIKTYGELVTSIINPSHRMAIYPGEVVHTGLESKMQNYNDVMTVRQLVDLVAFLQSQYTLIEYEPTDYAPYY